MKTRLIIAALATVVLLGVGIAIAATGSGNNFTTTTSMHLLKPIPGVTGGLGVEPPNTSWQELQNRSFDLIDAHNHSPGSGAPVPTSGLNINADLPFNGFNATLLRALRLNSNGGTLAAPGDLRSVYAVGGDLYYNNGAGTPIQITSGAGVAGTPGSIGGLSAPASATYVPVSTAFVWQSNTNTAASMDAGPITLREKVANALGITLQSPAGLAGAYSLTLPTALPGAQKILSIGATGQMFAAYDVDGASLQITGNAIGIRGAGVTSGMLASGAAAGNIGTNALARTQLPLVGQQVSASCGAFTTTSTTYVDVTNLTVTITTNGRPVILSMQPDGTNVATAFEGGAGNQTMQIQIVRGVNSVAQWSLQMAATTAVYHQPIGGIVVDAIGAGTYTYKVQALTTPSGSANLSNYVLTAYEL